MNELQNSLFEAMKVFSDYGISKSDATKTVQATITAIKDAGANLYEVSYLGQKLTVHANSDITYSVGNNVYILIPDGDFSNGGIIISSVNPMPDIYVTNYEESQKYFEISDNLIQNNENIKLCSYREEVTIPTDIITDTDTFGSMFQSYLDDNYRLCKFSFSVKTLLDLDQQKGGNYGAILRIPLKEIGADNDADPVWESVVLDTGNMIGNPYHLEEFIEQEVYFKIGDGYVYYFKDIDGERKYLSPTISYFCKYFIQNSKKTNSDIFIQNPVFDFVVPLSKSDNEGFKLLLKSTEGTIFLPNGSDTKTITPTLRVNGKNTSLKEKKVYWFTEDANIKATSKDYLAYGGYGWRCINKKENVKINEDGTETFDYKDDELTLLVKKDDVQSNLKYKCVVLLDSTTISETIELKPFSPKYTLNIKHTNTSEYIKDVGYIDLTIILETNLEIEPNDVKYNWIRYNKDNMYINDIENYYTYNEKINEKVSEGVYETNVKFPVKKINELNTFCCSATYVGDNAKTILLGTASIVVKTIDSVPYGLSINNANILYNYDTDGDAPTSPKFNGPVTARVDTIPALTYTLRKEDGQELTDEEYQLVNYCWKIPKSSLFIVSGKNDEDDKFVYIKGIGHSSLPYSIAPRFDWSKSKNSMILEVEFQGRMLETEVPIIFTKEGISGTNGTSYSAELGLGENRIPYGKLNAAGFAQKLNFVYNINESNPQENTLFVYDYDEGCLKPWADNNIRIYPNVFLNGQRIEEFEIEYTFFDEKITKPCFKLLVNDDKSVSVDLDKTKFNKDSVHCNIIQAKIIPQQADSSIGSQENIYCYYPIEYTVTNTIEKIKIDNTIFYKAPIIPTIENGFSEVMYATDGTNPSWDASTLFKCNDTQLIDSDISEYFIVNWDTKHHLKVISRSDTECYITPDNKYDSGNSCNYVKAELQINKAKTDKLKDKKSKLEDDNNHIEKDIVSLEKEKNSLEDFANSYTYDYWIKGFSESKTEETLADIKETFSILYSSTNILIYSNIKEKCNSYIDKIAAAASLSEIKNIFDEIYNNVLSFLFDINDKNILSVNDITNKKYEDTIVEFKHYIVKNKEEISHIEIILNRVNSNKTLIYHVRPIVLYFNRYGFSNLNGWDGNKIETNDGYLLAPQVGAGVKEEDNSFTGIVMGVRGFEDKESQVGLFGYANGNQTFRLDAHTGSAIFGKDGKGQIIIDPRGEGSARLYSSNYFNKYDPNTGLPDINSKSSEGMLIDLTKAEINIATYGKIYSGEHTELSSTKTGFYLGSDGISFGSKAYIDSNGVLKLGTGATTKTGKHWTVDGDTNNSYIAYGTTSLAGATNSVYLGTDGLSFGKKFKIEPSGTFKITYGSRDVVLNPKNDKGEWDYKENEIYFSTDGLRLGKGFEVASSGTMWVGNLNKKYWTIQGGDSESYIAYGTTTFKGGNSSVYLGTDGISLGNKFSVDRTGDLTATKGAIGGWVIGSNYIASETKSGKKITLNSNGSIEGNYDSTKKTGWKIDRDGNAIFHNITAMGGNIGGCEFDENGDLQIGDANVKDLDVESLKIDGKKIQTSSITVVTGMKFTKTTQNNYTMGIGGDPMHYGDLTIVSNVIDGKPAQHYIPGGVMTGFRYDLTTATYKVLSTTTSGSQSGSADS